MQRVLTDTDQLAVIKQDMVWTQNAYKFLEIGALTSIHNSQSHETSKTDQEILKLIVSLRTEKEKLGKG